MTSDNVIELFPTIPEMEAEMNKWQMLTYDQKRKSDDACMNKYGCTNEQLYAKHYVRLQAGESLDEVTINIINNDTATEYQTSDELNYIDNLMKSDPNMVIIKNNDSKDTLDEKYNKYSMLTPNYKDLCDDQSLKLYGKTFIQKYNEEISKIEKIYGDNLPNLINNNKDALDNSNFIEHAINRINCLTRVNTLVETCVLEDVVYSKFTNSEYTVEDIPYIVPFYTFDEFVELNPDAKNTLVLDYLYINDQKKYYDTINKLYEGTLKEETKELSENSLIKLGWCPYICPNGKSIEDARKRQIDWLNENFNNVNLIDLSKYDIVNEVKGIDGDKKRLEPIFLTFTAGIAQFSKVIMAYTNSDFSHSGISLSSKMDKIYSFNMQTDAKMGGLSFESIEKYTTYGIEHFKVLVLFVDKDAKAKIKEQIDFFINNKKTTKYGFENFFNIVFNIPTKNNKKMRMVCSQFVDYLLKSVGVDITNKPSNLVSPENLINSSSNDNINIYQLFDGNIKKYKQKDIDKKIDFIKSTLDYSELSAVSANAISDKIKDNRIMELFNITCSDNKKINNILREMRDYIKPNIVPELTLDRTILDQKYKDRVNEIEVELSSCGHTDIDKMKLLLIELKEISKNINPYHNNEIYNKAETLYNTYFNIVQDSNPDFAYKLMDGSYKFNGNNLINI